jgi:glycosyltransferase involved in cell wall biosynthesis
MRAIQVVNVRFFNATAWYGLYLAQLMEQAGHQSLCLVLPGTEAEEYAAKMGVSHLALDCNTTNPLRIAALYARMYNLVQNFQPDVINCHRGEAFILWGLLRKQLGSFKLVRTRGDQRLPKNNVFNRWLHGQAADAVVATNSRMARHFQNTLRLPPDKLWMILGGVDKKKFRFDAEGRRRVRAEFGYNDQDVVVGMVGRFDMVKGQHDFIRAVSQCYHQSELRNIKVLFIGFATDTSEEQVWEWCSQSGIRGITSITGTRDDLAACISALDIGISASLFSETIARAPMELMACARPLIATEVGVLPDIVPSQATVPAGNPPVLARTLARAIQDTNFRNEVVRLEQETMSQFSGKDFLRKTMVMYRGL